MAKTLKKKAGPLLTLPALSPTPPHQTAKGAVKVLVIIYCPFFDLKKFLFRELALTISYFAPPINFKRTDDGVKSKM